MDLFDQAFDEEFGAQDVGGLPEGYDLFDSVFDEEFGGIGTDQYPEVGKKFANLVAPPSSIVPFSVIARAVRSGWGKAYEKGWIPLTPERAAGKAVESIKELAKFPTVASLAAIESAGRSMQEERRQMDFPELYASLSPVDRSMIGPMISDAELRKGMPLSMDEKRKIASTFNEGKTEGYIENAAKAREFIQKKLKTDPAYLKSTGYIEDAIGVGGQVGGAILASVVAGPWAGGAYMGAYIAGATYENLTDQGVEPDRAIKWGIANGIMQAPFEAFGLSKVAKLFKARKALFQAVKDLGFAGLAEWTTEFIQAIPESITEIFAKNPDKTALENWTQVYENLPETLRQGAYEGLVVLPWTMFFGAGGVAKGVHIDKWEKYAVNYLNDETKAEWKRIQKLPESEMSQGDKYQWLQDQANAAKQAEDIDQPTVDSPDGEITPEKLKEMYAAGEVSRAELESIKETLKNYPDSVAMIDGILAGKEAVTEGKTQAQINQEAIDRAFDEALEEPAVEEVPEKKPVTAKAPTRFEGELDIEAQKREIERLEKGVSPEEIEARAKETIEAARKRKEAEGIAQREKVEDAKERLKEIAKGNILVSVEERQRLEDIAKEPIAEPVEKPKPEELKRVGEWVEPVELEPEVAEKIKEAPKAYAEFDFYWDTEKEGEAPFANYTVRGIPKEEGGGSTVTAKGLAELGLEVPETPSFEQWKKDLNIRLEAIVDKEEAGVKEWTKKEQADRFKFKYELGEVREKRVVEKAPEVVEAKPAEIERRVDIEKRKRIDEMTPEEMQKELKTDFLTGLGNKRALHEAKPKPVMSSLDMDSLGYINDTYGHDAGDVALKLMGDALKNTDAVRDTYHISGDEFVIQGETEQEVDAAIQRAYEYLKKNPLEVEHKDGSVDVIPISFSYGKGETYETADKRLLVHKKEREARGERSPTKVETPGILRKPARGVEAEDRGEGVPEAEEVAPSKKAAEKPKPIVEPEKKPEKRFTPEELKGITVMIKAVDEDFNIYEVEESAEVAISEMDEKIESLNEFLECVI